MIVSCCVLSFVKEYLLFYDVRQDVLQLCHAVMCHTTFYTACVYTQSCIERPWNTTTSAPHHPVRQQHPIQTQCYTGYSLVEWYTLGCYTGTSNIASTYQTCAMVQSPLFRVTLGSLSCSITLSNSLSANTFPLIDSATSNPRSNRKFPYYVTLK